MKNIYSTHFSLTGKTAFITIIIIIVFSRIGKSQDAKSINSDQSVNSTTNVKPDQEVIPAATLNITGAKAMLKQISTQATISSNANTGKALQIKKETAV